MMSARSLSVLFHLWPGIFAAIRDLRVAFAQDWSLWFVLAITVVVISSVIFFYRRAAGTVPPAILRGLLILRLLAMLALLLCLFRPVISYHRQVVRRAELIFLLDASRSMTVRDYPNQPDRFKRAASALLRPGTAISNVQDQFDPSWFVFDAVGRPLDHRRELDRIEPEGEATDLTQAVRDAVAKRDPDDVAGVVMLTDGIDNSVLDPAAEIAALKVPVFPVAVGSKLMLQPNYKDVRVAGVDPRREVALNSTAEIRVYVDAVGYPDHVVPVVLYEGEKEVDRSEVALDNAVGNQTLLLHYHPEAKGDFEMHVEIPIDPAERIQENNRVTFPIFVTDPKIKVLLLEGVIRQEYRAVRRVLQFDPNVELVSFVRTAPEGLVFLQQGSLSGVKIGDIPNQLEQLKNFDVIILGSVDLSVLKAKRLEPETIKKFVEDGGGFLAIGGRHSFGPGGYGGTAIEEILPVYIGGRDMGQEEAPFFMRLDPPGIVHPIFAGCAEFFTEGDPKADMKELRVLGCSIVLRKKPAATILASNPQRRNEHGPLIVLAVQPYPRGRTAALTIDSTWRWYRPLRGMGRQSPFIKFWGQIVRWLAGHDQMKRSGGQGVVAYTDKHFYEPGDKPRIYARVTDKEGKATPFAEVTLELTRLKDNQTSEHRLPYVEGTYGDYELEIGGIQPGKYKGVVTATLTDPVTKRKEVLGSAEVPFRMSRPNREFEKLDVNDSLLDRIAEATGGKRYTLLSIDQLAHELRRRSRETGVYTEWPNWQRSTALLLPFLAIVALLSGEWILRKKRHML